MSKSANWHMTLRSHSLLPNWSHALNTLRAQLNSRARSQHFLVDMSIVDYELKAAGRDYATKYGAFDDDGWTHVPVTAKFLSTVSQAHDQTGEETEDHVAVPLWVLALLAEGVYELSELGLFASESMVCAHV